MPYRAPALLTLGVYIRDRPVEVYSGRICLAVRKTAKAELHALTTVGQVSE